MNLRRGGRYGSRWRERERENGKNSVLMHEILIKKKDFLLASKLLLLPIDKEIRHLLYVAPLRTY